MNSVNLELGKMYNAGATGGGEQISNRGIERSVREAGIADSSAESGGKYTFGDWLKSSLQEVAQNQSEANMKAEELIAGRNKDIHGTMLAFEKADVSLRMLTQVRNKVIDAYREIMRMQI